MLRPISRSILNAASRVPGSSGSRSLFTRLTQHVQHNMTKPSLHRASVCILQQSSRRFLGNKAVGNSSIVTGSASPGYALYNLSSQLPQWQQRRALSSGSSVENGAETMEFQAETRKLLDIVTHSIYTDKEVFVRELISNASDALEKFRYAQVTGAVSAAANNDAHLPLEIHISTDPAAGTISVTDNGVGMSREELVANLGTIARSGSKHFVDQLSSTSPPAATEGGEGGATTGSGGSKSMSASAAEGIIGQFGVGFYSSFMVADRVVVESMSATGASNQPYRWSSDGSGVFKVENVPQIEGSESASKHGTKITMHLMDSCKDYSDADKIKDVIKRYSNFVSFPIFVNGEVVNTVSAIWAQDKSTVTEEQYEAFYKFIANAFDSPRYRLHFRADAPIDLKVLFYVPTFHAEKFGMGRTELGVNLYSRKVLIESKPKDLLPDWLRFIKGAVDSEDLPLSLSREKPQDSSLLRRIRDVLTRKLIRFFSDEMKNHPDKYREFYLEYHMFLKEGVCQDYQFMDQLSKLLMFESSAKMEGELVSLDDYISRCGPEQKHVYYLVAPSREAALASPYYETFKKHGKEVLLLYNTIDDFVMANVKTFAGRTLTSAETSAVDLAAEEDEKEEKEGEAAAEGEEGKSKAAMGKKALTDEQAQELCAWLSLTLGEARVREVKVTKRLSDSPAIVTDHESGALRRMMKMVEQANAGTTTGAGELPPQVLEVNPAHPLVRQLFELKDDARSAAPLVAEQLLDNCLIAAGLVEDARFMLPRLNDLLLASLKQREGEGQQGAGSGGGAEPTA